jgi:PIN domain nuclease of toxin-antitoxin system
MIMTAVVIDTHVLIWYISDIERLSKTAIDVLERSSEDSQPIYISSISLIEITYLVEKGRITMEVLRRVVRALDSPSVNLFLCPIDRNIAVALQEIDRSIVPEMPDRVIAATALFLQAPLLTRDLKIRALSNITTIW